MHGQYQEGMRPLQRHRINEESLRVQNVGILRQRRYHVKRSVKDMSLNAAIESKFVKMMDDESCTDEEIRKFARRWTYKRGRKREFRICLD